MPSEDLLRDVLTQLETLSDQIRTELGEEEELPEEEEMPGDLEDELMAMEEPAGGAAPPPPPPGNLEDEIAGPGGGTPRRTRR